MKMRGIKLWSLGLIFGILAWQGESWAGIMEFSSSFSYSRTNYSDVSYSWSRRVGLGLGYYFWGESELEFEVQDILFRTKITDVGDTSLHDQIFSIQWVQGLAPSEFWIHPYFKVGVGQLNRVASGSSSTGEAPLEYGTITGVLGAGVKFKVYHELSLKIEGATYLINGSITTAQDNFAVNSGLSIYF